MSDTPKLLALMAKSRDVNAIDYSKQLEVLVRDLERENAALRAQNAWLVATFGNLEDENQKLRAELEAQAVVNGKGGEREAKLLAQVAELRNDKERLDWLERYHLSLSRLTSPDMSGLRFVGQCFNPARERGKGGPSYLKIEGSTIRSAIDAARKETQP